jgi:hypothetical protein
MTVRGSWKDFQKIHSQAEIHSVGPNRMTWLQVRYTTVETRFRMNLRSNAGYHPMIFVSRGFSCCWEASGEVGLLKVGLLAM